MKKITLIMLALVLTGFAGKTVNAQGSFEAEQLGINAGITYGLDIEEPGIRLGATYFLDENMRVGGDLTYWLIDDGDFHGTDITYLELNGNFNYLFHDEDGLIFYGIGALGLHYASVTVDIPGHGTESDSDTELGLGLGAGIEYNLNGISLFGEPKLFLSGFDQVKINAGVRIYL